MTPIRAGSSSSSGSWSGSGAGSGSTADRRPVRHVPLIGDVAAGTGVLAAEHFEESLPLPEDFTGDGTLFMLRVRGESMIEAGILDGDYVVVRQQPTADAGDTVDAELNRRQASEEDRSPRTRLMDGLVRSRQRGRFSSLQSEILPPWSGRVKVFPVAVDGSPSPRVTTSPTIAAGWLVLHVLLFCSRRRKP